MDITEINRLIQSGGLGGVLVLALVALMYMVKRFVNFLETSLKSQNDERQQRDIKERDERQQRDIKERDERDSWRRIIEEHTLVSKQMYVQMEAMNRTLETIERRTA